MKKVHWHSNRRKLMRHKQWAGILVHLAITILWPLISILQAAAATYEFRNRANRKRGRWLIQDWFSSWFYSIHYMQPAFAYFTYRMDDPVNRRRCNSFIHNHETIYLFPALWKPKQGRLLRDKKAFWSKVRDSGLPTVPIIAEVVDSQILWMDPGQTEFPRENLFVKPLDMHFGKGVFSLAFAGDDQYISNTGESVAAAELADFLINTAGGEHFIIQPKVSNHETISELCGGGVCTVRLVTCLDDDGPFPLLASIRMPRLGSLVDNLQGGGTVSAVDMDSGRMGEVVTKGFKFIGDSHPDTGNRVRGSVLPYWKETVDLCLRAQQVFDGILSVGWDAIITQDGPVLLEGNGNWGTEVLQVPHNLPLGETRFLEFYARKTGLEGTF